jgi:hypothetical protein
MTDKILGAGLAVMMALMAWNFNTLNGLQLEVEAMMYKHAETRDYQELKSKVDRLEWMLQQDAMTK